MDYPYTYVSVKFRSLRKKTKLPYPEYNVNNLKYWWDKYSGNRWEGFDLKVQTLFKFTKDEVISKINTSVEENERIVRLKIELIIQHKDHYDSVMLYDYSAWDFGKERPGKWFSNQNELDKLIDTVKSV
jgi:hypothetical protein